MHKSRFFLLALCVFTAFFAKAQHASDSAGYFQSFDSTKIYYEVRGKGYPVLLVHGFINSGETWKKTAVYKQLQDSGYQVITMDMRGNGKSDKPHISSAYANDAEARDIMGLATFLGLGKYDIVGYSRGAIITARVMVLDRRVGKSVMGGMGTDFTNPQWPRRIMFYRALSGEPVKELEPMLNYVKEAKLDRLALAYMQKEQPSTSVKQLEALHNEVLVIIGNADDDKEKARSLAAIFARARYEVVPGDHGSALRTEEFGAAVVKFLRSR